MEIQEILIKLALAISLGALMGLARDDSWKTKEDLKDVDEGSKRAKKKFSFIKSDTPAAGLGGVRTYVLISMLGAIAGLAYFYEVYPLTWIVTTGFLSFVLVSFVLNYFDKNTFGLTTEISLILNFTLALLLFATDIPMKFIAMIAVLDAIILSMRTQMRSMVSKFSGPEIADTLKFVLVALVLLPFMPDETYGLADIPFIGEILTQVMDPGLLAATEVINPRNLWFIVALVLSLNFIGYFAVKALGAKRGLNVVGLLGGIFSSTAVTESMARNSKNVKSSTERDQYITAAVLANITSFFRVLFFALLLNLALGIALLVPMLVMAVAMLMAIMFTTWRELERGKRNTIPAREKSLDKAAEDIGGSFHSPFALKPALFFATIYLLVTLISAIALYLYGDQGYLVASMIAALSGLDAITINTAAIAGEVITVQVGMIVLVVAACVNLLAKVMFAAVSGDRYFQSRVLKIFIVSIICGMVAMLYMTSM